MDAGGKEQLMKNKKRLASLKSNEERTSGARTCSLGQMWLALVKQRIILRFGNMEATDGLDKTNSNSGEDENLMGMSSRKDRWMESGPGALNYHFISKHKTER